MNAAPPDYIEKEPFQLEIYYFEVIIAKRYCNASFSYFLHVKQGFQFGDVLH